MKLSLVAALTMAAGIVLTSGTASAQDQADMDHYAQAYNDAQFCAILLKKRGGEQNLVKSKLALAKARTLAAQMGHETEEQFETSYQEAGLIMDILSEEESKMITDACEKESW